MEEQKKNGEVPNSVEISINAKGQYSGKVKVYAGTIKEAYDLAVERAGMIEAHIRTKNNQ